MANLSDSDLLLVNRSNKSYKVTGAELKDYYVEQPTISSVVLTEKEDLGADRFNEQSFISTVTSDLGRPPAEMSIRGIVNAQIIDKLQTSAITDVTETTGNWTAGGSSGNGAPWTSVTYGDGVFVAVREDGFPNQAATSTDGINWTYQSVSTSSKWRGLTYGNGVFIAVSNSGNSGNNILRSDDGGQTWTAINSGRVGSWSDTAYDGKGTFVKVATSGNFRACFSTNQGYAPWGLATFSNGGKPSLQAVTYGNGIFVAVGPGGTIYTSSNGTVWDDRSAGAPNTRNWNSITYGNGKFVAVSGNGPGQVMWSTDGISWTAVESPEAISYRSVTYAAGLYVAVAQVGQADQKGCMVSTDAINWTATDAIYDSPTQWESVTYGKGKYVAVAYYGNTNTMHATTAGATLKQLTFADNKDLSLFRDGDDVVQENGGAAGTVATTNAVNSTMWFKTSTGTWANGQTVIGPPRPLTTSEITNVQNTEGSWREPTRTQSSPYLAFAYGESDTGVKGWSAVGGTTVNSAYWSRDGEDFTQGTLSDIDPRAVAYGNGTMIAVGVRGAKIRISINTGQIYGAITTPPSGMGNLQGVCYGDNKFVAVGAAGTDKAFYSNADGTVWYNSNTTHNGIWQSVTYGDGKFVAVSSGGTYSAMYSENGETWLLPDDAPSSPGWMSVAHGNGRFVAVSPSRSTRLMWSDDGISWTDQESLLDDYEALHVGFADGIFVAAGGNHILVSVDGISWTLSNTFASGNFKGGGLAENGYYVVGTGTPKMVYSPTGAGDKSTLTFADDAKLANFRPMDPVDQDNENASGIVQSIDVAAKSMTLFGSEGAWSANTGNFVVGPNRASTKEAQLFCKLNNSLELIDLQETNPGYTKYTGTTPTIKFPYYLPNGQAVDNTLLPGSSIYTQVKADNLATPAVTKKSNTVTPASTCIAGPIETAPIASIGTLDGGWNALTTSSGLEQINYLDIAYGDGRFVAVAYAGTNKVAVSEDGLTWQTKGTSNGVSNNTWASVAYGNGRFVAVENNSSFNRVIYSDDGGDNWTASTMANNGRWGAVEYGADRFVACDNGSGTSRVNYSIDGKTWNAVGVGDGVPNFSWWGLCYGQGKWIVVGGTRILYSDDSTATKFTDLGAAGTPVLSGVYLKDVAYGAGKFVAVEQNKIRGAIYSDDGITWQAANGVDLGTKWVGITYAAGLFVAVGELEGANRSMYSADGINWTANSTAPVNNWQAVAYGDEKFVAIANGGTQMGMWSYTGAGDLPLLTFENERGLSELNSGDNLIQENAAASGVAAVIDADQRTMSVAGTTGTWAVGQTVTGPNRVCPAITFDASDPADVAQFEAIKASFEGYETSKKLHRAGLISRMIVAGFTEQQISAFDLDTADVALNINGYYPLYTTEVLADAAGNGASHSHEIDGVTYYMPDGGVPIYHGSYNEPEDTTSDSTDSSSTDTTDSGSTDSTDSDSTDTTDSDSTDTTDSDDSGSTGQWIF